MPRDAIQGLMQAGPILKWAGGKSQLLAQYAPLFPTNRPARYFEPFVGSAAVFFHLRGRDFAASYHLSDSNPDLVNAYTVVRDDVGSLITRLAEHRAAHTADAPGHFYAVRALDRDPIWAASASPVERAARMIYLNKTCYNGLWRVNSRGYFNAPLGRYANPPILDENKLRAAALALQGVTLTEGDFRAVLDRAAAGDFVYFDPPYVPLSRTANFTDYAAGDFGEAEQRALAEVFRALDGRGCRVMLSNSDTPLVWALYEGYTIATVQARRAVNSRPGGRGHIREVVVLNTPQPD